MNARKKIFLSFMALGLTIVSFVSATFAWLSLNSDVWIEGMELEVTSGEGFLVSVDDEHFKTILSKEEALSAILLKYHSDYHFNENGILTDAFDDPVSVEEEMQNIKLFPLTSVGSDTFALTLREGAQVDANSGSFFELDLYFVKNTNSTETSTGLLDVYLNGKDRVLANGGEEVEIPKTALQSELDQVVLQAGLTVNQRPGIDTKTEYVAGENLKVRSSNAMRMGIIGKDEENEPTYQIVEMTDEYDLGSYATTDTTNELYDAEKNAMFTYYNHLRGEGALEKLEVEQKPETIRSLTKVEGGDEVNQVRVCRLEGTRSRKVTFRFWLEGWDADCFNGISQSIKVQLSFAQKR